MDLQGKSFRNENRYPWQKNTLPLNLPSSPCFPNIPRSFFRKVVIYSLVDLLPLYIFIYIESILGIACYNFRGVVPVLLPSSIRKQTNRFFLGLNINLVFLGGNLDYA